MYENANTPQRKRDPGVADDERDRDARDRQRDAQGRARQRVDQNLERDPLCLGLLTARSSAKTPKSMPYPMIVTSAAAT